MQTQDAPARLFEIRLATGLKQALCNAMRGLAGKVDTASMFDTRHTTEADRIAESGKELSHGATDR